MKEQENLCRKYDYLDFLQEFITIREIIVWANREKRERVKSNFHLKLSKNINVIDIPNEKCDVHGLFNTFCGKIF